MYGYIQVAQYQQSIDMQAVLDYLSKYLRNVCLASSYAVLVALSTMRCPVEEKEKHVMPAVSSHDKPTLPRATLPKMTHRDEDCHEVNQDPARKSEKYVGYILSHKLPMELCGMSDMGRFCGSKPDNCCYLLGLKEMLRAESEWMLACLGVDTDDEDLFDFNSKLDDINDVHVPQPLPPLPLSSSKGEGQSADMSKVFTNYSEWVKDKQENAAPKTDQIGVMRNARSVSKRMQEVGVPDTDICVLLSLLVEETKHEADHPSSRREDMITVVGKHVTAAVQLWRLVAYCKLTAMVNCSNDKVIVGDLAKAEKSQFSLNVFDFDGMEDVLSRHDTTCTQWKANSDESKMDILALSPFDGVGKFVRQVSSIAEVPMSYLQGMSFLSTNGGFMCDPWVLAPSLSTDSPNFYFALSLNIERVFRVRFAF